MVVSCLWSSSTSNVVHLGAKRVISVFISRYGDRYRDAPGAAILKIGMNVYRLVLDEGPKAFVFVETVTPNRVAVVDSISPNTFDIRTFNTLNGYHPGSDLRVRVYREGDPDLLSVVESVSPCVFDAPEGQVLVQAHGRTVQHPVVEQIDGKVSIETLITRTPATPLETNIEIAVVRNLGPIRGR